MIDTHNWRDDSPALWLAKGFARSVATDALRPYMALVVRRQIRKNPQLHLGCGPNRIADWVNVDLLGRASVDVALNLRRPFPLPSGCVAAVYHEHLLEHLPYPDAYSLLSECARVLRRGGVLRVGVPDFGAYARSYASDGRFVDELRPGRPSRVVALAEVAYAHGHRSLWDAESLITAMRDLGIVAERRTFGDSALDPCPDTREAESVYVEGVLSL